MDSYIVRIYRLDNTKPRAIVGTVEAAGEDYKMAFMNMDELWNILNPPVQRTAEEKAEAERSKLRTISR